MLTLSINQKEGLLKVRLKHNLMNIKLKNVCKIYNNQIIFKDLNLEFLFPESYVVLGKNGSGKSTLLKCLSGFESVSKGEIIFNYNGNNITIEEVYKHISITAPYVDLIEDFTLKEMLKFHFSFKKLINGYSNEKVIEILNFPENDKNKKIKNFSSGQKQKIKLALNIFSDTKISLFDEPLSNLDRHNYKWYKKNIEKIIKKKLIIVCSNGNEYEHFFCNNYINIEDYK